MSINVGTPNLKLDRAQHKGGGDKNTGNYVAMLEEAYDERHTSDPDLNRELTRNNIYLTADFDLIAENFNKKKLTDEQKNRIESELYINKNIFAGVTHGKTIAGIYADKAASYTTVNARGQVRHVQKNANIALCGIIKPAMASEDWMAMNRDQQIKFLTDSFKALQIMYAKQGIIICSAVIHLDEANPHLHYNGYDPFYKLEAKFQKTRNALNADNGFRGVMKKMGYDITPADTYAKAIEGKTAEEIVQIKQERRLKKMESNKSKVAYVEDQKAKREADKIKKAAETESENIKSSAKTEAEQIKNDAHSEAKSITDTAKAEAKSITDETSDLIKSMLSDAMDRKENAEADAADATKKAAEKRKEYDALDAKSQRIQIGAAAVDAKTQAQTKLIDAAAAAQIDINKNAEPEMRSAGLGRKVPTGRQIVSADIWADYVALKQRQAMDKAAGDIVDGAKQRIDDHAANIKTTPEVRAENEQLRDALATKDATIREQQAAIKSLTADKNAVTDWAYELAATVRRLAAPIIQPIIAPMRALYDYLHPAPAVTPAEQADRADDINSIVIAAEQEASGYDRPIRQMIYATLTDITGKPDGTPYDRDLRQAAGSKRIASAREVDDWAQTDAEDAEGKVKAYRQASQHARKMAKDADELEQSKHRSADAARD